MTRIKRGSKSIRKIKTMRLAKGFKGSSSRLWRVAKQRVNRALAQSYTSRRLKKRIYRRLWIKRISAVLYNIHPRVKYSEFTHFLKIQDIQMNRKVLSQVAICDRGAFEQLVYLFLQTKFSN
jgi:large subunit ribosomal protein L20